jgi:hypothetical protein
MRHLILGLVLGLALPAFAAEDPAPATEVAAPDELAATLEPTTDEAAPAVEPELAAPAPTRPPLPAGAVARGTFATAIDQREPIDSVTSLGSDRDRVYYFNEFVGIDGRRVTHRWAYQGAVVAEVPIAVGGPRWRAYSSKNLLAGQLGEWTVSVVDESGRVVSTDSFVYQAAATPPEIAAPAADPAVPDAPPAALPAALPDESPAAPAASPEAAAEFPAAPAPAAAPGEERAGSAPPQR